MSSNNLLLTNHYSDGKHACHFKEKHGYLYLRSPLGKRIEVRGVYNNQSR